MRTETGIQKTKGGAVYPAIARALGKLGSDISLARRARRISTADFAAQMGVSRATLQRLEAGDAGCSLNTLASALHALGRVDLLRDLLDQAADDVGLMVMRNSIPRRVKGRAQAPSAGGQNDTDLEEGIGW
jgi:transcriptional regulator with XRE-family HTH domain